MNLLELHKENLRDIWSFITEVKDIISFASTCKFIGSLAFDLPRDLFMPQLAPIEVWKNIFSRDLRHLKSFGMNIIADKTNNEYIEGVLDLITIITNCRNLKSLYWVVNGNDEQDANLLPKYKKMNEIVRQMTWLEYLDAGFLLDYNVGELLKNHANLTSLVVRYKNKDGIGYEKLTQIKSLAVSSSARDEGFRQVLEMDNLADLDLSYTLISNATANQIWKLTNLETLNMTELDNIDFDWRVLLKLPKLSSFTFPSTDMRPGPYTENQYAVLNSLTQLTYLDISGGELDDDARSKNISNLTNLRQLSVVLSSPYEDLSIFPYITTLEASVGACSPTKRIRFPRGLKSLHMAITSLSEEIWDDLENMTSLNHLQIYTHESTPVPNLKISCLTNLQFYQGRISTSIANQMTALPYLRSLALYYAPDWDIEALQRLTQVCRLYIVYMPRDQGEQVKALKQKLPYEVINPY